MALVFNVFSFEIRRQLLQLILFEVSRRFVGVRTVIANTIADWSIHHSITIATPYIQIRGTQISEVQQKEGQKCTENLMTSKNVFKMI